MDLSSQQNKEQGNHNEKDVEHQMPEDTNNGQQAEALTTQAAEQVASSSTGNIYIYI
jgi:hypothetical protein